MSNSILQAAIVHHTGSMIRFTTSQLPLLPKGDISLKVVLPNGEMVNGKFRRNPANPYIGGPKIVGWIKSVVQFGQNRPVRIIQKQNVYVVSWTDKPTHHIDSTVSTKLDKAIRQLLRIAKDTPAKRRQRYTSFLQRTRISDLFKQIFGYKCQVENCEFTGGVNPQIYPYITDIHHLEHLSAGGSNTPLNLCVLCSNHHSLFHRDPSTKIISMTDSEVLIETGVGQIRIVRDLSLLGTNIQ